MILLDTDIVTHLSYGDSKIERKVQEVADEELAITIITRYEMLRGRAKSLLKAANKEELEKAAERFQQTEKLVASFNIVGFNDNSIEQFGRLKEQKQLKMKRANMLIACIALAHNALLVTRNTKDFEAITGLRLDNWKD